MGTNIFDPVFGGIVSDTPYDAVTWDDNTDVPTKNAVRDKIESITSSIVSESAIIALTVALGG